MRDKYYYTTWFKEWVVLPFVYSEFTKYLEVFLFSEKKQGCLCVLVFLHVFNVIQKLLIQKYLFLNCRYFI